MKHKKLLSNKMMKIKFPLSKDCEGDISSVSPSSELLRHSLTWREKGSIACPLVGVMASRNIAFIKDVLLTSFLI